MGQIMEVHIGNILDTAQNWLKKNQSNTQACIQMLSKLFTILDSYEDKRLANGMIANLTSGSISQQQKIIQDYIDKGIHLIFPPFQSPKLKDINEAAKLVGAELESILYLPKYGRKTMNKVTWGKLYILKLEHISATKQNVRSIGKSITTSLMPGKPGYINSWAA